MSPLSRTRYHSVLIILQCYSSAVLTPMVYMHAMNLVLLVLTAFSTSQGSKRSIHWCHPSTTSLVYHLLNSQQNPLDYVFLQTILSDNKVTHFPALDTFYSSVLLRFFFVFGGYPATGISPLPLECHGEECLLMSRWTVQRLAEEVNWRFLALLAWQLVPIGIIVRGKMRTYMGPCELIMR